MNEVVLPAWLAGLSLFAAAVAGLIGSLRIIHRYMLKPGAAAAAEIRDKIEALNKLAERELTANGGSSMKDRLDQVAGDVAIAKQTAEDVIAKQASLEVYVHERFLDFANTLTVLTGQGNAAEQERLRRRTQEDQP